MRSFALPVYTFLILISATPNAWSAGVKVLADLSDLIVVATVRSRVEGSTGVTFDLEVVRVLKGNAPGRTVSVVHEWFGVLGGPERKIDRAFVGL